MQAGQEFSCFYGPRLFVTSSQNPFVGYYPEPAQSTPYLHILFI